MAVIFVGSAPFCEKRAGKLGEGEDKHGRVGNIAGTIWENNRGW